ncbi:MAG: hypothetical protein QXQ02_06595 [Halobacteria archaeon]
MSWDFITIKKEKQGAKIVVEGVAYEVDGESKMRYLLTINEKSITLEISPPGPGYDLAGSFIELLGKPEFGPEQEFGGICGEFEEDARLTTIWSLESSAQSEKVLNYVYAR